MTYTTIQFGEYPSGSRITFEATNISANQVSGTLKQVVGKKLIQRQIVARDLWDWNVGIEGIYTGSTEQLEDFKDAINQLWGTKQYYNDGVGSHTGSYLITNNGFTVDENPENYNNEVILFSLDLVQYQQV